MDSVAVDFPSSPDEWAKLTNRALDDKLAELDVALRRIEAAMVAATAHADRVGHHLADGHRSVASWMMATTNCSRGEATARKRSADVLRSMPTIAAEFAAGRVGVAQIRELGRLGANPRCGERVAGSEDVLLAAAQTLEFADFRVVTRRWESLADADGAHREHDLVHEHRTARCTFDGARFRFETSHGVIAGAAMRDVFEAFCSAEFDRDWSQARAMHGEAATPASLARTAAQRRADAFVAMVMAAAAAGTGDGRAIEPTVNLVCDLDQFERYVEAEILGGGVDVDPASVRDRRCETTDGEPVDPRQLVAAAFVGRIRLIVTDGAGVIVHAGRKRPLFTGALREAIQAIDPVCGWLGCTLRAQIAAIDHLQPRSRGGPTDAANAKVMCQRHNVFKHTADYRVERRPDGTIAIIRPDGTVLGVPDAA